MLEHQVATASRSSRQIASVIRQASTRRGQLATPTLSRRESGRNGHTEAMGTHLRLVRDVRGTIEYLCTHDA